MKIKIGLIFLSSLFLSAGDLQGIQSLSGETKALLTSEMRYIEKGMHDIFSNIIKGEYEQLTKTATDIQDSFIFNKSLTKAQRVELKKNLPQGFIELDHSFHSTAGKLSEAAEFGDKNSIEKNFTQIMGLCLKCHATYATYRFGGFSE